MFLSYAQNLEDVILYRALGNIKNGFYIDVGAGDPIIDSVTKAFYDRGWSGLDIDPIEVHCSKFRDMRPRDIVVKALVSDCQEYLPFYIVEKGLHLSTAKFVNIPGIQKLGFEVSCKNIYTMTLDEICNDHRIIEDVHFLKIDVEGYESKVLRGFSFRDIRPWVLIIEAVDPITQKDISGDWHEYICSKGYIHIYCDRLNRFYLALEHIDISCSFKYPPNVFDKYIRYQDDVEKLKSAYEDSLSWRLTKPVRILGKFLKEVR